ncbi:sugar-transfer associated ATP-grasp domain-containing protein [Arenibacter palladensis]|uniref:sugar-transfer associated ATP-grasp domain-containing protein n=1 Tax=Arenibacter palladensis TaxID=237373 RepID=UPI0026E17E60|nr:sugar-transfer associated ATP-grasp domain-containing protein [Arenibacter palladensis]MDO6605158.1 sugar-transfer associated ATP-grasp domain-containing protein [Arenibacter palladensis]
MVNRLLYLGHYIRKLDRKKFKTFGGFVTRSCGMSKTKLLRNIIGASLKYNISLMDYFYFKFYKRTKLEKRTYAGTGYMYEYQLRMNPKSERNILENKLIFLDKYAQFISHQYASKELFLSDTTVSGGLFKNPARKLVVKSSDGQCGEGIIVMDIDEMGEKKIMSTIKNSDNDLIEEFIIQHDSLMKLSPSGLNTVRIFTQLDENDNVDILGCRLRITINSYVDNLAAGNIAAPIDEISGIVNGAGVYSDITKNEEHKHPMTGIDIVGFQVPFWKESLGMVKEAALWHKENRSIGWDVAITNKGPGLLEGNHNWCKLLWQLPVKKGLKNKLEAYK